MSQQPIWITEEGSLGVIPEGKFYTISLEAYDPDFPNDPSKIEYSLQAGELPSGVSVQLNGLIEGVPVSVANVRAVPTEVSENTEARFAIRATNTDNGRIADRTFSITVTGQDVPSWITDEGEVARFFDGQQVSFQFEFEDLDSSDVVVCTLVDGDLPKGTTLSEDGLLSGFAEPEINELDLAGQGWSNTTTPWEFRPWDYGATSISRRYSFTLQISDGKDIVTRDFSIFVYSRDSMTADTTEHSSDIDSITADTGDLRNPYLTNYMADLGSYRHDNFFAYKLEARDPDADQFEFILSAGFLPPGVVLDAATGWIYGYLPDVGLSEIDYEFSVKVRKTDLSASSTAYPMTLKIVGVAAEEVVWLTDEFLGTIDNGDYSTFYVEASHPNYPLQYRLKPGAFSRLPQGLRLLTSGEIVGQVSFKTFSLDGGSTTFDSERETRFEIDPTTFDLTFRITVEAYSRDEFVTISREFYMLINRRYDKPYAVLYAEAMPPRDDRFLLQDLLYNSDILPPTLIYRPNDPYFGVARRVRYNHAYGLEPATIEDYFAALELNHYEKQLTLGEIKTAQALDDDGDVLYEVVYSEIQDDLVNANNESVSKIIDVNADQINTGSGGTLQTTVNNVYPNSLDNMRDQVIAEVGRVSQVLPRWMLSKQPDGRILGFTPAWIIAYVKPGSANLIAYRIAQAFGEQLNKIDFQIDRFTLDFRLTELWDLDAQAWEEAVMTTFDRNEITADNTVVSADANNYLIDQFVQVEPPPDEDLGWSNDAVGWDGWGYDDDPDPGEITEPRDVGPYGNVNETIFDGGSTRFISPVDTAITSDVTDSNNRYIKFPQVKIIDRV